VPGGGAAPAAGGTAAYKPKTIIAANAADIIFPYLVFKIDPSCPHPDIDPVLREVETPPIWLYHIIYKKCGQIHHFAVSYKPAVHYRIPTN
jgi:hypothetical protein